MALGSRAGVKRVSHFRHGNVGLFQIWPEVMEMGKSRFAGLVLALFGLLVLLSNLGKPRIAALHGSDIVGLVACGMCFGVGLVGMLGRLKVRNE